MSNDDMRPNRNSRNKSSSKKSTTTKKTGQTSNKAKKRKKKKKKLNLVKFFTFIAMLLVLLITIGLTIFFKFFNKLDRVDLDKSNLGITDSSELSKYSNFKDIKNIALFGIDAPNGENGRSDATMILTIDPVHNKIKLTSLMRDSYVAIKGNGEDKLNHAYAYGGPELAIRTINENFGLNIEDFATVNFSSLPKIINILGGVDIEIRQDEIEHINFVLVDVNNITGEKSPMLTSAGMQNLDGNQALAYSRVRATAGGDFERTERQRVVLSALFNKVKEKPISSFPSLISKILPFVQTNLTSSDILAIGTKMIGVGNGTLEQQRFPKDDYCYGDYVDEVWYLMFDKNATTQQIRDYLFDDIISD